MEKLSSGCTPPIPDASNSIGSELSVPLSSFKVSGENPISSPLDKVWRPEMESKSIADVVSSGPRGSAMP